MVAILLVLALGKHKQPISEIRASKLCAASVPGIGGSTTSPYIKNKQFWCVKLDQHLKLISIFTINKDMTNIITEKYIIIILTRTFSKVETIRKFTLKRIFSMG